QRVELGAVEPVEVPVPDESAVGEQDPHERPVPLEGDVRRRPSPELRVVRGEEPGGHSVEKKTFLGSEQPSIACMPSWRPKPDCLKPPNGVVGRTELFELTDSTPVSSARATRIARAPSRVQIEPDRPYGVSLAIRIASASSSNGISAATGPKTSSR